MDLLAGAALLKLPRCTLEPLLEKFLQFRYGTVFAGSAVVGSSKSNHRRHHHQQQQENAAKYSNGRGETFLIQATQKGDEAGVVMLLLYACLVQQTSTSSSFPSSSCQRQSSPTTYRTNSHVSTVTKMTTTDFSVPPKDDINDLQTQTNDSRTVLMRLLSARDKRGMEALHYAADLGHTGILQCLIELGGTNIIHTCAGYAERTALHIAAAAGHADSVRFLLQAAGGPSPNANKTKMICTNDLFGQTALHLAAESGHTAVLSLLLDQQEEVKDDDQYKNEHVNFNTNSDAPASRNLFHVRGSRSYWTPLHSAVFSSRVDCVQRLLQHKDAYIDCLGDEGQTPLHLAAGRPQQIKRTCLSSAEEDPSSSKKTPTTMEDPLVHLLLAEGVSVHARDWHGETPLFKSAFAGNEASARVLLQYGANPKLENDQGQNALDIAVQFKQKSIVSLLSSVAG